MSLQKPIKRSPSQAGFTLIEILVALCIVILIAGLGLFLSMDFYKSYVFNYEEDLIISLLQKARSQSLANINEKRHGVHFDTNQFVLFEDPYSTGNKILFDSSSAVTHNIGATTEIIFEQLTGRAKWIDNLANTGDCDTTKCGIKLSYNGQDKYIYVNQEGRIYE